MPLYTYDCRDHGIFREWSSMSESDRPRACPDCGEAAPRAMARPMLKKSDGRRQFACDTPESFTPPAGGGCGCGAGGCVH